jgi:hypothetical protein
MAFEYSFRGIQNWVEVAKRIARSDHTWATEEEEFLGEVGYDIEDGGFYEEQIEKMSEPTSLQSFSDLVAKFRDRNALEEIRGDIKLAKMGML